MSTPIQGAVPDTKFILASRRFRAMAWPVLTLILVQTGLGELLGPLEQMVEGLMAVAGPVEWLWHHFRPDGKTIRLAPRAPSVQPLLIMALCLNLFGCAGVDFDGGRGLQVSAGALVQGATAVPGSVLTDDDCGPLEEFAAAMRDRTGSDTSYRWLWKDKSPVEQLAGKADIVAAACRRLQELGSIGATADQARATIAEFWTNVGVLAPETPDETARVEAPVLISVRRHQEPE
jgi:hypothetical protein